MTGRTYGLPLTAGVNRDPVDIAAGLRMAIQLGYDDSQAEMVTVYALQRWKRGEEEGAEKTWLSHFGNRDYVSWRMVLAAAIASGSEALRAASDA